MNRRVLLQTLPVAVALPTMAATPARAQAETPVMQMYRRYMAKRAEWLAVADAGLSAEEDDALYDQVSAIEAEMMKVPSQTPQDMAAKMVVGHCFGDLSCLDYDGMLWTEARALIGGAA